MRPFVALTLVLLGGCTLPVSTIGNPQDDALWLVGQGMLDDETPMEAWAFVLTTQDDYCEVVGQRFAIIHDAARAYDEAVDAAGNDPEALCEAEQARWEARFEAEQLLYFREARHTVLFDPRDVPWQYAPGEPQSAGILEPGEHPVGPNDTYTSVAMNTLRAHSLPVELDVGEADCGDPQVQGFANNRIPYEGPPREHWMLVDGADLTVSREDEESLRLELSSGMMEFQQEVTYGWPGPEREEIVELDEQPRDPEEFSFDRTFRRCEVDVHGDAWWTMLWWALLGAP